MPRPIIGLSSIAPNLSVGGGAAIDPAAIAKLSPGELDRRLLARRSNLYVKAMAALDAGTHQQNRAGLEALLDAIRQEFPEVHPSSQPLGIVARCHLEHHEVHTLDCVGGILRHFKPAEAMPGLLERARTLALHPAYAFVEVYNGWMRAVRASGEVAIIPI
jgi:hypothetical protein